MLNSGSWVLSPTIAAGDQAFEQLSAAGFAEKWDALHLRCPWAAPAQSFAFVSTWYSMYRHAYSPVLVVETDQQDTLTGVLPLALSRANGRLVVAGDRQGEYKAWVSLPTDDDDFITRALLLIRREFPGKTLVFKYLPAETPLGFLSRNPTLKRYCAVRRFRRPLLRLNEADLTRSFRKKSNKSRVNRLKSLLGAVSFDRVTTASEAEPLMDQIAEQCDLRQGAAHDVVRFQDDPQKKLFYTRLLEKPDLLHFTVMKGGSCVLSAHLGLIDKKRSQIEIGVFSHSVSHARHSPGKLHIMMLGLRLLKDKVSVLDLTPGGDFWKERFASFHDEVCTLTMYGALAQRWSAKEILLDAWARLIIRLPPTTSIEPAKNLAKNALRLARLGLTGNLKRISNRFQPRLVYRYDFPKTRLADVTADVSRDKLGDLLAFQPERGGFMDRQAFLANACARLERGHHCYTRVDERGVLSYCAWLVERCADALESDLTPGSEGLDGSVLLVPCALDRDARDSRLLEKAVHRMLRDAQRVSGARRALISLPARDRRTLRTFEKLGFVPVRAPTDVPLEFARQDRHCLQD